MGTVVRGRPSAMSLCRNKHLTQRTGSLIILASHTQTNITTSARSWYEEKD